MRRPTRTAVLATVAAAPLLAGGWILQSRAQRDGAQLLEQVMGLVSQRFVDTVGAPALFEKAARGLVKELNDPYTELFTPKQIADFSRQTNGRYGGLGMEIVEQSGFVTVARVFPHTPAEAAGIQEGDRIVQIDTANTRGWKTTAVQNMLLGAPGTKVKVSFARPGVMQPITDTFTRAEVHIPAVGYSIMFDGTVGYVPVTRFSEATAQEIGDAVRRLSGQGAKGIVLDLRDNPGGILEQAISTSNLFLRRGQEVASVRGRQGDQQTYVATSQPLAPAIPLVVLVNGYSASASEIVAGALQDHDRAVVVGTTSYGKGLVQTLFPLDGGYALKMTTAKWFTPSGRSIQKDRKLVDGQYVEVHPDSLESDSARKARPQFKSDAGRVVYGGGAVTPDVIVKPDTLSTAEQQLARALAPKFPQVYTALSEIAFELKGKVQPTFTVDPAWREQLWTRLQKDTIKVERAQWDAGRAWVDRQIEQRVARVAFGDSTAKRHELDDDVQLRRAIDMVKKASAQRDLFAMVPGTSRLPANAPTPTGTAAAPQGERRP
ncbi:S41 family peptidase [Roseisolibacter sp. H3M3-2]|uniref:S41 family peptidase n=1 Tax=Roseisolibacter sp. H3M3-2 TaxID=3031323 RepID=UPI0023DAB212|nr:S41 family peptidase [Roseisolibacter sp. H3M3-2]MDF1503994.1 S41 family peptidase [Roseisolibacter sp. H3M3-2]